MDSVRIDKKCDASHVRVHRWSAGLGSTQLQECWNVRSCLHFRCAAAIFKITSDDLVHKNFKKHPISRTLKSTEDHETKFQLTPNRPLNHLICDELHPSRLLLANFFLTSYQRSFFAKKFTGLFRIVKLITPPQIKSRDFFHVKIATSPN